MKTYDAFFAAVLIFIAAAALTVNLCMSGSDTEKQYLVDAARICKEIEAGREVSAENYPAVTAVTRYSGDDSFFTDGGQYLIRKVNGEMYRIEYITQQSDGRVYVNAVFLVCALIVTAVLIYIRQAIVKPFNRISSLPYELSTGDITIPLKEQKSRYFGKFLWGLDMLREGLEKSSRRELEQAKAEKTLLLSLSHDIKTPLSGIKLGAKALQRGLYTEREKQAEAAENIGRHADEIERYVNEMIDKLSTDFMQFEVHNTEFYTDDVIHLVQEQYRERLAASHTGFTVGKHANCLIKGDPERLTEVMQNLMENAVKYGDGREIDISFGEEEDCCLITVRNSGCTLPESELTHIFDSFWRGSNAQGRQGNGLGLFICRRLMYGMNGDIFAQVKDGYMGVTAVCRKA